jgi:hypothetical protein
VIGPVKCDRQKHGVLKAVKVIFVAASLLSLAACSGSAQRAVESDGYTIYVHSGSLLPRGGTHALVVGLLALRDRCVVLERSDGSDWYPVVWPSGTRIASTDPFVVRLPSGAQLAVGESVRGGGGYTFRETLDVDIPTGCLGETQQVAVFNPDDKPEKD